MQAILTGLSTSAATFRCVNGYSQPTTCTFPTLESQPPSSHCSHSPSLANAPLTLMLEVPSVLTFQFDLLKVLGLAFGLASTNWWSYLTTTSFRKSFRLTWCHRHWHILFLWILLHLKRATRKILRKWSFPLMTTSFSQYLSCSPRLRNLCTSSTSGRQQQIVQSLRNDRIGSELNSLVLLFPVSAINTAIASLPTHEKHIDNDIDFWNSG